MSQPTPRQHLALAAAELIRCQNLMAVLTHVDRVTRTDLEAYSLALAIFANAKTNLTGAGAS